MFGTMLRFEVRYHLTRPVTYLYVAVFFVMTFLFMTTDAVQIGGATGQVMRNAPWVIAQTMLIMLAVGQVILTGIVGTSVLRDYQYRTHELLFTTSISRWAYLGGRFAGSFVTMVVVFLAVPLGMIVGSWMPWVDHTKLLPLDLSTYAITFLVLLIPSLFLLSAIFFAVGALTRNLFAIYTQGMVLLVAWSVAGQLTKDVTNQNIAALTDPLGLRSFALLTRYWSVVEKNTLTVPFAGPILLNRIVWTAIAVGLLVLTYALFKFRSAPPTFGRKRAADVVTDAAPVLNRAAVVQRFDTSVWWQQLRSATWLSFLSIVRQVPFGAIVIIGMINLIMTAAFADTLYGAKVYPVTYSMVEALEGSFSLYFIILITIYAGEAVWRERQLQADQIVDALPARSSVFLLGKLGGLALMLAGLLVLLVVTGVAIQTAKGYHHYELALYLKYFFGTTFPSLIQITVLAMLVHVLVNQKFVGHLVVIVLGVGRLFLSQLGVEHQLFNYAGSPTFSYSDMNRFGPFVPNLTYSVIYWTGVAIVLGVLAFLYWIRGTDARWGTRQAAAKLRWAGPVRAIAGGGLTVALAAGGAIFYNTNILNQYRTSKQNRKLQAQYERTYQPLNKLAVPRLVAADVRADLEPERAAFTMSGTLKYVNRGVRPLDTLLITTQHRELRIDTLTWNRPTTNLVSDSLLGTRIDRLSSPLAPGDTIELRYRARFEQRGFPNQGPATIVVDNGTFVNSEYFPVLGYQEGGEIGSDDDRKKEKLAPKARMASLNDEAARSDIYIGANADWIDFKATVSTAPDQIAIAPGYLVKESVENGRRVFRYEMDRPMLAFYSFLSARYQVKRDEWNGIKLEIYYHPGHEYNLDQMMAGMKRSLEYFSAHFSPYQFRQLRILEFPRYATFAQAFPNTVPFSESIGFILRTGTGEEDLDMPFYVTAHEVGHQWWAHQVIGANLQGSTFFSEGLANYSALTVIEKKYGTNNLKKFLANELDRYLAGRGVEAKKELPLMLVENQGYIHYNKGSLALYAFRDLIGEEAMNRALAKFVKDKAFQTAPFTTSREFLGYLDAETPDSLKYAIEDLFRTITLWDDKVESATATRRADGKYDVAITIKTLKFRADSLGGQTEIPMADLVDVGVFGAKTTADPLGKPLYLKKTWIHSRDTTITVVVEGEPVKAGIDPFNKLIDRDPKDNLTAIDRR